MFFPIGDDNVKGRYTPIVTYLLIAVNCYIFWQQLQFTPEQLSRFFYSYGSIPAMIWKAENLHTLFTSMFLHSGWMHIIGNMLFLAIFADNIEATIGNFKFLLFYLAGGVFAALVHCFVLSGSTIPCIGASGAISATLGAYLVMFPSSRVRVLFFIFAFRVSAFIFLGLYIIEQVMAGVESLKLQAADSSGVGYWAHIGGFAYGFVRGWFFRRNIPKSAFSRRFQ
ncbi:MAG: Rhomboid family protein [Sphingobacteriaceae bacterium]|jgi:membrane associated rhomboid family serine protease|nr:Rhomboid family protein [Sphingobacteriaceae bacterium]